MTDVPTPIAVAVVQRGDEFLVGRRPQGAPLAGFWEFPGGKVQAGETLEEAACRECLEETGVEVEIRGRYLEAVYWYEHGRVRLHFFACRPVDEDPVPNRPYCWVTRDQLSHYKFPPANRELLQLLTRQ